MINLVRQQVIKVKLTFIILNPIMVVKEGHQC